MGERSQSSERPDWCAGINCPNYETGRCYLRDWVNRGGYVSNITRNRYYKEFREQLQKDPEALRQRCFQIVTKI